MNQFENLTESQVKKKVIRISSRKKDELLNISIMNRDNNMLLKSLKTRRKLDMNQSSRNCSPFTHNQIHEQQDKYNNIQLDNQEFDGKPFYMETSRFKCQEIENLEIKNNTNIYIPEYLIEVIEKQKKNMRMIWNAVHLMQNILIKKYYYELYATISKNNYENFKNIY